MENQIPDKWLKRYSDHERQFAIDTEAIDLTYRDCLNILRAIKIARFKINQRYNADQRKGRLPPEGRANVNLLAIDQYDDLFNRVQKALRALEKRYKKGDQNNENFNS